jgi:hypothetical protein
VRKLSPRFSLLGSRRPYPVTTATNAAFLACGTTPQSSRASARAVTHSGTEHAPSGPDGNRRALQVDTAFALSIAEQRDAPAAAAGSGTRISAPHLLWLVQNFHLQMASAERSAVNTARRRGREGGHAALGAAYRFPEGRGEAVCACTRFRFYHILRDGICARDLDSSACSRWCGISHSYHGRGRLHPCTYLGWGGSAAPAGGSRGCGGAGRQGKDVAAAVALRRTHPGPRAPPPPPLHARAGPKASAGVCAGGAKPAVAPSSPAPTAAGRKGAVSQSLGQRICRGVRVFRAGPGGRRPAARAELRAERAGFGGGAGQMDKSYNRTSHFESQFHAYFKSIDAYTLPWPVSKVEARAATEGKAGPMVAAASAPGGRVLRIDCLGLHREPLKISLRAV